MSRASLPEFCFETLSKAVRLERVSGFEDIEHVKLLSGEDGGGIKIYRAEKIPRVNLVDFRLGAGIPVPHHENRPCVCTEVFQITPDLSCRLPIWGINSVVMKDGTYYFDTDLSFGFDLVMNYEFTMKYLEPFSEVYKKFSTHPDLRIVPMAETTTWVRTYISPVFFTAVATTDKLQAVFDLAEEFIMLWLRMYRDAERGDDALKQQQQARIRAQYAGMKNTDRMGKLLLGAFGQETFAKFFKAMSA